MINTKRKTEAMKQAEKVKFEHAQRQKNANKFIKNDKIERKEPVVAKIEKGGKDVKPKRKRKTSTKKDN